MSEPLNPVQIEQNIRNVSNLIAEGVKVCSDRYKTFLDADREYDSAFARAYLAHEGPAHEKRYAAEIKTTDLRRARDDADGLYRHADRRARSSVATEIHHRKGRGKDPVLATAANGAAVCRSCHQFIEDHAVYGTGLKIRKNGFELPHEVPVSYRGGAAVYFRLDGTVEPIEGAA